MAEDLYTSWLGIPAGKRPPDYYALLGIARFTQDQDAIEQAVRQRMDKLDQYALHPDRTKRDTCQTMMNELATARVHLVNAERKAQYDRDLARALGVKQPEAVTAAPTVETPKGKADPRKVFDTRLRKHLMKWALDPHEQRLLVAEAALLGISESEAVKTIHRIDAEAEKATRKWYRMIAVVVIGVILIVGAGVYFLLIAPAMQQARLDAAFYAHLSSAERLILDGRLDEALTDLDAAHAIRPGSAELQTLRQSARFERELARADQAVRDRKFKEASANFAEARRLAEGNGQFLQKADKALAAHLANLGAQIRGLLKVGKSTEAAETLDNAIILAGDEQRAAGIVAEFRTLRQKMLTDAVYKSLASGQYSDARTRREAMAKEKFDVTAIDAVFVRKRLELAGKFRAHLDAAQTAQDAAAAQEYLQAARTARSVHQLAGPANKPYDLASLFEPQTLQGRGQAGLQFAAKLLSAAKAPPMAVDPALQFAFCLGAYDRGLNDPDGYDTAIAAARWLWTLAPKQGDAIRTRELDASARKYPAPETLFAVCYAERTENDLAAACLKKSPDETRARLLELTAKPITVISPEEAKTLADWHRRLAAVAALTPVAKLRMEILAGAYDRHAAGPPAPEPAPPAPVEKTGPTVVPDQYLENNWLSENNTGRYPMIINWVCEQYPDIRRKMSIIRGQEYDKGLSMWAPAKVEFAVKPEYRAFVAEVGLDQQSARRNRANLGSAIAKVWIDGTCVFTSDVRTLNAAPQTVNVPIPPGSKKILLEGVPTPQSKPRCILAWGNAGFLTGPAGPETAVEPAAPAAAAPPQSVTPPKPDVLLTDLAPVAKTQWGQLTSKASPYLGQPLSIAGKPYTEGIGLHADARVIYALKPAYERFVGYVGVHDHGLLALDGKAFTGGSIAGVIEIDGRKVLDIPRLAHGQPPLGFDIPIPKNAGHLTLVVTHAGDASNPDLADWTQAGFVLAKDSPPQPPTPPTPPTEAATRVLQEITTAVDEKRYLDAGRILAAFRATGGKDEKVESAVRTWIGSWAQTFEEQLTAGTPDGYTQAIELAGNIRALATADQGGYDFALLMPNAGDPKSLAAPAALDRMNALLKSARGVATEPALAKLLAAKACDYGLAHKINHPQALAALEKLPPPLQTQLLPKILPIYRDAYRQSIDDRQRTSNGSALLDILLQVAERNLRNGQWDRAATLYREAKDVAEVLRSNKRRQIDDQLELIRTRAPIRQQAAALEKSLATASPYDAPGIRRKLFTLYYAELANEAKAAQYVDAADDRMQRAFKLLDVPIDDLSFADCDLLIDVHRTLAEDPAVSDVGHTQMLRRQREYLQARRTLLSAPAITLSSFTKGPVTLDKLASVRNALVLSGANQTLVVKGDGRLLVGPGSPVNFYVGALPSSAPVVAIDMSELAALDANLLALTVGSGRRPPQNGAALAIVSLKLPRKSVVTAQTILVAQSNGELSEGMTASLLLGTETLLHAEKLIIGTGPLAEGSVSLPGPGATLDLRGRDGGNTRIDISIGSAGGSKPPTKPSTLDFSTGTINAMIGTLQVGAENAPAIVSLGAGTVEVQTLTVAASGQVTLTGTHLTAVALSVQAGATLTLVFPDGLDVAHQSVLTLPANAANETLLKQLVADGRILADDKTGGKVALDVFTRDKFVCVGAVAK